MTGEGCLPLPLPLETPELSSPPAQPPIPPSPPLCFPRIVRFHAPLVAQAVLLTLSGPLLGAIVARAAEPRLELAAFWLAFGIALFAQSVCLALQQSTVAFVRARAPLQGLTLAGIGIGLAASMLVLMLATTPLGSWIFSHAIPTSPRAAALAREVLRILAPVPLLVALRSIGQGIAVGERRTHWVALTTAARLLILSAVFAGLVGHGAWCGARTAAWAVLLGIGTESMLVLASAIVLRRRMDRLNVANATDMGAPGANPVLRLAAPLAVAALGWTATRPLLHAILGRLAEPEPAQAAFGVVLPWLLLAGAPVWALFETTLVLAPSAADTSAMRRFALGCSCALALGITVFAASPVRDAWLGLDRLHDAGLEHAVAAALPWLALSPILVSLRAVAQAVLVREERATWLFVLAPLRFVLVAFAGFALARAFPHLPGPVLAVALVLAGDAWDACTYSWAARRPRPERVELSQVPLGSVPMMPQQAELERRSA